MEYTTVETFKTAFEKVTVLSAVTFSKWGAVRAALEKYNSYFEIDLENFDKKLTQTQRDSVYKQMIGVEFSDYADVKRIHEALLRNRKQLKFRRRLIRRFFGQRTRRKHLAYRTALCFNS